MRASRLLLVLLIGATPSCKPSIPNPFDVAKVAIDGSFLVLDETGRAVRAARRASAEARPSPGNGAPQGAAAQGWAPPAEVPGAPPTVIDPPQGRVVQAQLSGEDGESQWLVQSGGRELCKTPCALQYPAGTGISLVQVTEKRKPTRLALPTFQAGSYDVQARPRNMGAFAPGVVFSAFGGMGTIAGLVLTAVGCSQGNEGMCRGGAITFGVSSAALTGGIVLVAVSGARLLVERRP